MPNLDQVKRIRFYEYKRIYIPTLWLPFPRFVTIFVLASGFFSRSCGLYCSMWRVSEVSEELWISPVRVGTRTWVAYVISLMLTKKPLTKLTWLTKQTDTWLEEFKNLTTPQCWRPWWRRRRSSLRFQFRWRFVVGAYVLVVRKHEWFQRNLLKNSQ